MNYSVCKPSFLSVLRYEPSQIHTFASIPYCCRFVRRSESLSFTPYAVGEENGNLHIISESSCRWKAGNNAVTALDWSADDQVLAAGNADGTVKLWSVARLLCSESLPHHDSGVVSVEFHPAQSSVLLSGEKEGRIFIRDMRSNLKKPQTCILPAANKRKSSRLPRQLHKVDFIPCSNQLAAMCQDELIVYDSRWSNRILNSFASPTPKGFVSFTMDTNGNVIYALGKDSNVYTYGCTSLACLESKAQSTSFYSQIKYFEFNNEPFLVSTSNNYSFLIWDLNRKFVYREHDRLFSLEPSCIDVSFERNEIIICSDEFDIRYFKVDNGEKQLTFEKHPFVEKTSSDLESQENIPNSCSIKKQKRQSLLNNFFI